ncbi:hypothetical protein DN062_02795 [Nitrincola tibetensis]|uniref:Uncharacterized protein n=1 Tax=Nitrincola tibetensis TaxID=2219697 RepID=A0A364NQ88_9GAMM|nr:hypothetical protein [Nitrincola tibetensis]RAU19214.1 hypothetical protein DN062_02795 [Nitrincola tibetensis]
MKNKMIKPLVIAVGLASSVGYVFANQLMNVDSPTDNLPNLTSVGGEFEGVSFNTWSERLSGHYVSRCQQVTDVRYQGRPTYEKVYEFFEPSREDTEIDLSAVFYYYTDTDTACSGEPLVALTFEGVRVELDSEFMQVHPEYGIFMPVSRVTYHVNNSGSFSSEPTRLASGDYVVGDFTFSQDHAEGGEFKALLSADTILHRTFADDDVELDINGFPELMDFSNRFDQLLRYGFLQRPFGEDFVSIGEFSADLSSLNGVFASACELDDNVQMQNIWGPFARVREIVTLNAVSDSQVIGTLQKHIYDHHNTLCLGEPILSLEQEGLVFDVVSESSRLEPEFGLDLTALRVDISGPTATGHEWVPEGDYIFRDDLVLSYEMIGGFETKAIMNTDAFGLIAGFDEESGLDPDGYVNVFDTYFYRVALSEDDGVDMPTSRRRGGLPVWLPAIIQK